MKANEAPKKIYLQVCGDCPQTDCESCKFDDFEDNITWCKDRIFSKDIEYTRTDAFVKKAWDWINLHIGELSDIYTRSAIRNEFLEDFRKAMEE